MVVGRGQVVGLVWFARLLELLGLLGLDQFEWLLGLLEFDQFVLAPESAASVPELIAHGTERQVDQCPRGP